LTSVAGRERGTARNSIFGAAKRRADVRQCQTMAWNAITQNAFGGLLFLLVAMGWVCSEQTQIRGAGRDKFSVFRAAEWHGHEPGHNKCVDR